MVERRSSGRRVDVLVVVEDVRGVVAALHLGKTGIGLRGIGLADTGVAFVGEEVRVDAATEVTDLGPEAFGPGCMRDAVILRRVPESKN